MRQFNDSSVKTMPQAATGATTVLEVRNGSTPASGYLPGLIGDLVLAAQNRDNTRNTTVYYAEQPR
jgi:hypothetical protein